MKNIKSRLAGIALSSLFTAIICLLAQICITTPFGVPITLQIFAIALSGYILDYKKSVFSVLAYIFLGLIGIPVFSGFRGGVHTLFGLTGGFIIGFLAVAFFCSVSIKQNKIFIKILFSFSGVAICHLLGVIQLAIISKSSLLNAFTVASLPFILKDLLLVAVAYFIAQTVRKRFKYK